MQRPPRAPDAPLLSGFLMWRIIIVSALFAAGAFGIFAWAERRVLSLEEARTMVVNTIVVMEIFYLFSVRYLRSASFTWRGVLGTPAVLIGVGGVIALQLGLTYLPLMNRLFETDTTVSTRSSRANWYGRYPNAQTSFCTRNCRLHGHGRRASSGRSGAYLAQLTECRTDHRRKGPLAPSPSSVLVAARSPSLPLVVNARATAR